MLSLSWRFKFCLQIISFFLLSSCQNAVVELFSVAQSKSGPEVRIVGAITSGMIYKNVPDIQLQVSGLQSGDMVQIFSDSLCATEIAIGTAIGSTMTFPKTLTTDGSYQFFIKAKNISGDTSICSGGAFTYVLDTVAPTLPAISLQNPTYTPSKNDSPTVLILGVQQEDNVELYAAAGCTTNAKGAAVVGSGLNSITLTSSTLGTGVYNLNVRVVDRAGNSSGCTTTGLSYEVKPFVLQTPTIALQLGIDNPGFVLRPIYDIANLASGYHFDIFNNSTCAGTAVSTGAVSGGILTMPFQPSSNLIAGTYNYSVRSIDANGEISSCATTADYQLQLWQQQSSNIKLATVASYDQFGLSLSISGTTLAVGAPQYQDTTMSPDGGRGKVAIYTTSTGAAPNLIQTIFAPNSNAGDKFGYSVSISNNTLAVGAPFEDSYSASPWGAVDSGAVYVYSRAVGSNQFVGPQKIKAPNTHAGDYFGWSVSLDGDRLVIGAPRESSSTIGISSTVATDLLAPNRGAIYIYSRNTTSGIWVLQAYIKPSNASGSDYFGYAVAISGNLVLASAYTDGTGGANGIFLPAGKPTPNTSALNSGALYAYSYSPSTSTTGWSEEVYIKASNNAAGNNFGSAIAFDGFTAVIGAENESSNANSITNAGISSSFPTTATGTTNSGSAYIYNRDINGVWSQQAYVKPTNNNPYNNFGNTIAISHDTVVIGAPYEKSLQNNITNGPGASNDGSGAKVGAAYIFKRSAGTNQWAQKAYLKSDNSHDNDMFGAGLAILDDSVFVGAPYQATSRSTDTAYLTPQAGAIYFMRLNKGPIP